ncbi:MAG TPA: chemotaxis protein CheB [Roseiflexaceae bacterium]|nr:chemotaxis protein CheB [Roseiflexaceae bacterium]
MARRDIIVVGASAGAFEALKQLVAGLPADFSASLLVVRHIPPTGPGLLPEILSAAGSLPVVAGTDGDALRPGWIYVAPPDHHLLVERDRVRVTRGPKENGFRPAVDALFRSAAYVFGPRVIGVVLSGALDDGTAGLWAIKDRGGIAIVQDPAEAAYPSMPNHAIRHVAVDHIASIPAIAGLLIELTRQTIAEEMAPMSESLKIEHRIAMEDNALQAGVMTLGSISPYTCPDCHGTMVQLRDTEITRFRCHTGHGFTIDGLLAAIDESIDDTLWSAVRVLEERLLLLQQIEQYARDMNDSRRLGQISQQIAAAQQHIQSVRQVAFSQQLEL